VKRVPIPLVILLSLGAIGLPWWLGTRHMDFLKPPGDFQLARIRADIAGSFPKRAPVVPRSSQPDPADAVQSPIKPPPAIDPGDALAPAPLDAYRSHADRGAAAFIELAALLEEQSGHARALLAWERVLDSCRAEPPQIAAALAGIQRLRPLVAPWNIDPQAARPLVLEATIHSGSPPDGWQDRLGECAEELGRHSAGLLRGEARVVSAPAPDRQRTGRRTRRDAAASAGPAMLQLRILGEGEQAASTPRIDFVPNPDPKILRRQIRAAVYTLVASQLAATTDFPPPEPLGDRESPAAALATRITRLEWSEFGKSLQAPTAP
jgi:hypothetical protein